MQDICRRGAVEMHARCRGALVPQVDRLAAFRATGGTDVMDVVRLLEQVKAVLQERPAQRLDGADQLDVFCISCMFIRTCRKSKGPCVGVCLLAGCANIRFFVHHYALRTYIGLGPALLSGAMLSLGLYTTEMEGAVDRRERVPARPRGGLRGVLGARAPGQRLPALGPPRVPVGRGDAVLGVHELSALRPPRQRREHAVPAPGRPAAAGRERRQPERQPALRDGVPEYARRLGTAEDRWLPTLRITTDLRVSSSQIRARPIRATTWTRRAPCASGRARATRTCSGAGRSAPTGTRPSTTAW